jgi:hypothetical protein
MNAGTADRPDTCGQDGDCRQHRKAADGHSKVEHRAHRARGVDVDPGTLAVHSVDSGVDGPELGQSPGRVRANLNIRVAGAEPGELRLDETDLGTGISRLDVDPDALVSQRLHAESQSLQV